MTHTAVNHWTTVGLSIHTLPLIHELLPYTRYAYLYSIHFSTSVAMGSCLLPLGCMVLAAEDVNSPE